MEEIVIIIMGLIIGSFLNVVIFRLPREESLLHPRSHCPNCKTPIKYYHNIPVLSFLFLRGKCQYCGKTISIRYPLVEVFTAFSFWLSLHTFQLTIHAGMTIFFLCLLIVLSLIDLKHMILPDELTLGGASIFLIYSFFNPQIGPLNAFLSAIGAAALFAALFFFYLKIRKIEGLGFGDVKMMLLMGAYLGYQNLIVCVLAASILGLITGLFFIIFKKKDLKFALPFGTFLGIGGYISIFLGDHVVVFFQGLFK